MKTYLITFRATPTKENTYFDKINGAIIYFFILDDFIESALQKSIFNVEKFDWHIEFLESNPIEVTRSSFEGKDIGEEYFDKAQVNGMSMYIGAWSKDGKSSFGPVTTKLEKDIDLEDLLEKHKELSDTGRCLHFEAGARCNEIIKAHSIQKNNSLASIAVQSKVYIISTNMSDLRKNNGRISFKLEGINKVSIFKGFCKQHDNEIFRPIDDYPLFPNHQQICLYAYRSLCREVFVKENSYNLWKEIGQKKLQTAIKEVIDINRDGANFGLQNLKRIKRTFDTVLKEKRFGDIKSVTFVFNKKASIAFSGIFYPEYDFSGKHLQNLQNINKHLRLLTFCSAPIDSNKWGYLFAWHKECSDICIPFLQSLKSQIHENNSIDDMLFRLIISNCENYAISPEWWNNLTEIQKEEIEIKATQTMGLFTPYPPTALQDGLNGIANWDFKEEISNM